MPQPCPVEPSTAKTEHSHFSTFYLCQEELQKHTQGEKIITITDTQIFFYWHGSLWSNILCDSHCLPDSSSSVDHSNWPQFTVQQGEGEGFSVAWDDWERGDAEGRGGALGGWVGVHCLGLLCGFQAGRHVFIAILNLIAFLAEAWILNRPINGIPGMQGHDPLCSKHAWKAASVSDLCKCKNLKQSPSTCVRDGNMRS